MMFKRFFSMLFAVASMAMAPLAAVADVPTVAPAVDSVPAFQSSTEFIKAAPVAPLHQTESIFRTDRSNILDLINIDRTPGTDANLQGLRYAVKSDRDPVPWRHT